MLSDGVGRYVALDWQNLIGLKPWAHKKFVAGMTSADRQVLASEILKHIRKKGVYDIGTQVYVH